MTDTYMYDVANWKPITYENFVDALGHLSLARDDYTIQFTSEDLDDGRVRLVADGLVEPSVEGKMDGATSTLEPYLMVLWSKEAGKPVCFIRTNVALDDQR